MSRSRTLFAFLLVVLVLASCSDTNDDSSSAAAPTSSKPVLVAKENLSPGVMLTPENCELVEFAAGSQDAITYLDGFPPAEYRTCEPISAGRPVPESSVRNHRAMDGPDNVPVWLELASIKVDEHGMNFDQLIALRGEEVLVTAVDFNGDEYLSIPCRVWYVESVTRDSTPNDDAIVVTVWVTKEQRQSVKAAQDAQSRFSISRCDAIAG